MPKDKTTPNVGDEIIDLDKPTAHQGGHGFFAKMATKLKNILDSPKGPFAAAITFGLIGVISTNLIFAGRPADSFTFGPTLKSPVNGEVVDTNVKLNWNSLSGAGGYEVEYTNAVDANFDKATAVNAGRKTTEIDVQIVNAGDYIWRVRATGRKVFSPWSSVGTFTVGSTGSEEPPAPDPTPDPTPTPTPGLSFFRVGSWWEKALPSSAPIHPNNAQYIQELQDFATIEGGSEVYNGKSFLGLTGAKDPGTDGNDWAWPQYIVTTNTARYVVIATKYTLPTEFTSSPGIRIPEIAKDYFPKADDSIKNDREFLIIDNEAGYAAMLHGARWDATAKKWEVSGGSIAYFSSYGFDRGGNNTGTTWPSSLFFFDDDNRNTGTFRGNNPMFRQISYNSVAAGSINHVMEIFAWRTGEAKVFPLTGYESGKGGIIPEGTRIRIKPSIDVRAVLKADGLSGQALEEAVVIAKALQSYGGVIGDNSGSGSRVKVENTRRSNQGHKWAFTNDLALRSLPFSTSWEVIADNYNP